MGSSFWNFPLFILWQRFEWFNATVRWTVACRRLDGGNSLRSAKRNGNESRHLDQKARTTFVVLAFQCVKEPRFSLPENRGSLTHWATVHWTVALNCSNLPGKQKETHHKCGVFLFGGPEEIRTPDPYNANVMRSQLRYGPVVTGIL